MITFFYEMSGKDQFIGLLHWFVYDLNPPLFLQRLWIWEKLKRNSFHKLSYLICNQGICLLLLQLHWLNSEPSILKSFPERGSDKENWLVQGHLLRQQCYNTCSYVTCNILMPSILNTWKIVIRNTLSYPSRDLLYHIKIRKKIDEHGLAIWVIEFSWRIQTKRKHRYRKESVHHVGRFYKRVNQCPPAGQKLAPYRDNSRPHPVLQCGQFHLHRREKTFSGQVLRFDQEFKYDRLGWGRRRRRTSREKQQEDPGLARRGVCFCGSWTTQYKCISSCWWVLSLLCELFKKPFWYLIVFCLWLPCDYMCLPIGGVIGNWSQIRTGTQTIIRQWESIYLSKIQNKQSVIDFFKRKTKNVKDHRAYDFNQSSKKIRTIMIT